MASWWLSSVPLHIHKDALEMLQVVAGNFVAVAGSAVVVVAIDAVVAGDAIAVDSGVVVDLIEIVVIISAVDVAIDEVDVLQLQLLLWHLGASTTAGAAGVAAATATAAENQGRKRLPN